MLTFTYQAVNSRGQHVPGQLSAASRNEALQLLAQQTLLPLELKEVRISLTGRVKVRSASVVAACSLLADQLETGVPLLKALRVIEQQSSDPGLKLSIGRIAGKVADGSTLAEAMLEHPGLFGDLEVSMVRAGEEGGFLESSLRRLAAVRERQEELKGRLLSALAYPALLTGVGTIVVVAMLTFFVPKFEPLFESLRETGKMPWPTTLLLAVSGFLKSWGLIMLLLLAGIMSAARMLIPQERQLRFRDQLLLEMNGVGDIVRSLAISRFCRVLGTLLQNGVPMLKSMHIAREATGNRVLSEIISVAAENIGAGKNLAGPLAASHYFPPDVLEMLAVAEQSNTLEIVLLKLADTLEYRTRNRLDLWMKLLEPALMVIMAVVVGFLVIALLMPVFEANGLS